MTEYNRIITTVNSVSQDYSFTPDYNNGIVIDTSENRIGINTFNPQYSIDVSGDIRTNSLLINGNFNAPDISLTGHIVPTLDNTYDLGSTIHKFRDLYLSPGTLYMGTDTNNLVDVLSVKGEIPIFKGKVELPDVVGASDISSTINYLTISGDVSLNDGAYITKTLTVASDVSFLQDLYVTNNSYLNTVGINTTNPQHLVDINGTLRATDIIVTGNINLAAPAGFSTFNTNLLPENDAAFNIGESPRGWLDLYLIRDFYLNNVQFIRYESPRITLNNPSGIIDVSNLNHFLVRADTSFNSIVEISGHLLAQHDASFMETVFIDKDLTINQRLYSINDVSFSQGLYVNSDTSFNTNINVANKSIFMGNIGISTNNPLISIDTNANDAYKLPVGTTLQRPTGVDGYIRYNSDTQTFEGFGSSVWGSLGGVKDSDQDTFIRAESSPGAGNNELEFITQNIPRMTIRANGKIDLSSTSFDVSANNSILHISNFDLSSNSFDVSATNSLLHISNFDISADNITIDSTDLVSGFVNLRPTLRVNNTYNLPSSGGTPAQIIAYPGFGDQTVWVNGPATEFNSTGLKSRHTGTNVNASGSISLGFEAGNTGQGVDAIAIGYRAGNSNQLANSIAIGTNAGLTSLGSNSIAIGNVSDCAENNSIVINATGSPLDPGANGAGVYISSINGETTTQALFYNSGTNKITYGGAISNPAIGNFDMNNNNINNVGTLNATNISAFALQGNIDATSRTINSLDTLNVTNINSTNIGAFLLTGNMDATSRTINNLSTLNTNNISGFTLNGNITATGRNITALSVLNVDNITLNALNVKLGNNAGNSNQGTYAIAIGHLAANNGGNHNSIVLNAELAGLDPDAAGLFIKPIRDVANTEVLTYNTGTYEITHTSLAALGSGGSTVDGTSFRSNNANGVSSSNGISIGYSAGNATVTDSPIAIGYQAGQTNLSNYCIGIGSQAGQEMDQVSCIGIGRRAVLAPNGSFCIGIGDYAGEQNPSAYSICIGSEAGRGTSGGVGQRSVNIGFTASALSTSNEYAVSIGNQAGYNGQESYCVAIGDNAGYTAQRTNSISIGRESGYSNAGNSSISIGYQAGHTNSDVYSVNIGYKAGFIGPNSYSVYIGYQAGSSSNFTGSNVAIGYLSGDDARGSANVFIGNATRGSGGTGAGTGRVYIGDTAGNGVDGPSYTGTGSVLIGQRAGDTRHRDYCVAIGNHAGASMLGNYSIAIGYYAAKNTSEAANHYSNCIMLNASGSELNYADNNRFYVKPIRGEETTSYVLYYNTGSAEITYGAATGGGGGGGSAGTSQTGTNGLISYNASGASSEGVALGSVANASGNYAVAIGLNAVATGQDGISIGRDSNAVNVACVSIGHSSLANENYSVAIGSNPTVNSSAIYGIAIGTNATSNGASSVALSTNSSAYSESISIGDGSVARDYSVAIGYSALATNTVAQNCVVIGRNSTTHNINCVAIGNYCDSNGDYAVSIGSSANASDTGVCIGRSSHAPTQSVSLGWLSGSGAGSYSVAIGIEALRENPAGNSRQHNIGIGYQASKTNVNQYTVAIGSYAGHNNQSSNSVVINATGSAINGDQGSGIYMAPFSDNNLDNPVVLNTGNNKLHTAPGHFQISDDHMKVNEADISNALVMIRQLKPVEYEKLITNFKVDASNNPLKDASNNIIYYDPISNDQTPTGTYQKSWFNEAGFIAQDVNLLDRFSKFVKVGDGPENYNSMDYRRWNISYNSLFTYNVAATQELDIQVQNLQTEVDNLKTENAAIKSALNELLVAAGKPTIP